MKSQITMPLANSTNTSEKSSLINYYSNITTPFIKRSKLNNNSDRLSLIRHQKSELDELNRRFSNYVFTLHKRSKDNDDLQKQVDMEKEKRKNLSSQNNHELELKLDELRQAMDESAVLNQHFILQYNRALKEISVLKEKIRFEEDRSYEKLRQTLEHEYQQTLTQLKELTNRHETLQQISMANKTELNQMNDLYKRLEVELRDLSLNNMRLQCNIRSREEQILLKKAIYETEKAELANEQMRQKQFYTDELNKAIEDIKHDFAILLKNNQTIVENSYKERIEQAKAQLLIYEKNKHQDQPLKSRVSIETLQNDLEQVDKVRQDLENEYQQLMNLFLTKQKDKNQTEEEQSRLNAEYNRLINEINHLTEAVEIGKQYWFSVHFELETYKKLLDLETKNTSVDSTNGKIRNSKIENGQTDEIRPTVTVKKVDKQRAISKSGKFDIDQVQAGFISINNAATNCVDQTLKGWTLSRTINGEHECSFHFPDTYILRARTRVRVYSNKIENMGNTVMTDSRLIASSVPMWTSPNQGDNVNILLRDEKGIIRAQYSETWQ